MANDVCARTHMQVCAHMCARAYGGQGQLGCHLSSVTFSLVYLDLSLAKNSPISLVLASQPHVSSARITNTLPSSPSDVTSGHVKFRSFSHCLY